VNSVLTHTLAVDIGNNLRNDLIGLAPVSNQVVETGGVDAVRQANGGPRRVRRGHGHRQGPRVPWHQGFLAAGEAAAPGAAAGRTPAGSHELHARVVLVDDSR
jgi:hypothetical protein